MALGREECMKRERNSSIEMLRILAMLGIVIMHTNGAVMEHGSGTGFAWTQIEIKKLNSKKMFVIGVLGLLLSMICWDFWIKVVTLSIYAVGMTVGYCNLVDWNYIWKSVACNNK